MAASRWVTGLPEPPAPKCKGWLLASTDGTLQRQPPSPPRCVAASSRSLPERKCWSCSNPPSCPPLFPAVKEQAHCCHQAGPAPGVAHALAWPWEGSGGGEYTAWDWGTWGRPVGRSGQQRQGHLFWSRCPQRSRVTAEMGTVQPVGPSASQLSPTCFVTPSHSLTQAQQQPWRAWSYHLSGRHHLHPASRKGGTFRDRCHSGPWPRKAHSRPDKGHGDIPALGVQEHRLMQVVPWEASSQLLPAAAREQVTHLSGDLWGWGPCPAPQHPVGPGPRSALPRAEPILVRAQGERAVPGFRHSTGLCHLLPL